VSASTGVTDADVAIAEGRIALIAEPGAELAAREVLDVSGLHVMPGVVDPHQHVGVGDGMEDYRTDTAASALGGVTSVWYMLMAPNRSYLDVVAEHDEAAADRAYVDYSFHPTLMGSDHVQELPQLREQFGLHTFKYYMHFRGDEGAYLGVTGTHDGMFYEIVEAIGEAGDLLMVHAENPEVVWLLQDRLQLADRVDLAAWDEARPAFVEAEAVRRATFFAGQTGCELYLVHITTADGLAQARSARREMPNLRLAVETCPHYLTHSVDYERGIVGKVNPPLRRREHCDALWEAIADGTIDTLGSDHVGRGLAAKQGTIWTASAGFPSGPETLPVLLSEGHHRRGISLERIADLTSRRPAQLMRCADRKGDVLVGLDADLAIVDLDWERTPDPAWLGTFADYSLYENFPLRGWPRHTFVRGTAVVRDGEVVGTPGHGRYISRPAAVVS
jgi:dihydropyrimidinase